MNIDFHNSDIRLAYNEGLRAYYSGKPREDNIYDVPGYEDRAAAWWLGWDHAQEDDLDMNNLTGPGEEKP